MPRLRPRVLGEAAWSAEGCHLVKLACGRYRKAAGPLVAVRSALVGSEGHCEPDLADVLADERDRLFDHAAVDEPEPDHADERSVMLMIDGTSVPAVMRTENGLWAARVDLGSPRPGNERLLVTVVSRGVPVEQLQLSSITDLRPYLRGRWTMGTGLAVGTLRQMRHRPRRPKTPAVAEVAHLELIDWSVAESERIRGDLTAGRRPRSSREAGSARAARWEAAVRAQMAARHQGRRDANDAVTAMVNQMTQLAGKASWFADDPTLRRAAIDETIRFTADREPVRSLPAQQVWLEQWTTQQSARPLLDEIDPAGSLSADRAKSLWARAEDERHAERKWLAAWSQWADAASC